MPKSSTSTRRPPSSPRWLAFVLAGLALGLALIGALIWRPEGAARSGALPTLTPIPGLKATLTALPKASPMPAERARPYREVRALVEQCDQYTESRKIAILQQIDFVLYPATAPMELLTIYGDAWPGRMIFGGAYFTALEWKQHGQDKASCLYPIGVRFNALLRDQGEEPLPEFE